MIVQIENNLDKQAQYSFLSFSENSGVGTVRVKNINAFSLSEAVQIGKTGEETAEVLVLDSNPVSGTSLIFTANTRFPHAENTPLYDIKYDQVIFKRSTSGTTGAASAIGTVTITPDSNFTQFDDTTGISSYAYKACYSNSVTGNVSSDSDWLTPAGFSFYSLASIRNRVKDKLPNANYLKSYSIIDDWTNEWLEEMNGVVDDVNKDYNLGTVDIALGTTGLGTITATDFKELRRVWFSSDGITFYKATKKGMNDYNPNETFNDSYPFFYYQGDNVIGKLPQTAGTARLAYYKLQTLLRDDTDELPIAMRGYTNSFVNYALGQAYYLDTKDQKGMLFDNKARDGLNKFRNEITPRAKTGGESVLQVEPLDGRDNLFF